MKNKNKIILNVLLILCNYSFAMEEDGSGSMSSERDDSSIPGAGWVGNKKKCQDLIRPFLQDAVRAVANKNRGLRMNHKPMTTPEKKALLEAAENLGLDQGVEPVYHPDGRFSRFPVSDSPKYQQFAKFLEEEQIRCCDSSITRQKLLLDYEIYLEKKKHL